MKKTLAIVSMVALTMGVAFAQGSSETTTTATPAKSAIEQVQLNSNTPKGDLEIFSWWAGDEGPALKALIGKFNARYPQVNLINATVTGGSGVNAKAVLKTRMLNNDPPEAFQVHAGQELIGTWVTSDRMLDLTPLYKEEGWLDVFPKDVIGLIGTDTGIWSVPVCVHKSNVMWYIPENLKKWGVTVPTNLDEFFKTAAILKAKGVIPLSMGQTWTATENWENVALATLGGDDYEALWNGGLSWTDPKVIKVWENFGKLLEYTNSDAPSLSWQQATDMVVQGQAAFNWMGDWAAGYMMTTLKLAPKTGFGWANVPGTKGYFQFLSDSFGIPKGCKNPDAAVAWLKECGSKEGQDAFNPLKGSIPVRTDADMSLYSEYSKSAAHDFANDRIVGSLAHGVVAPESFLNDFSPVIEQFMSNKNAQQAAAACAELAEADGMTK
ncbi:MAG: ABC transporter substrate-binding protein [Spirochaetia bacterium]|nr:ABC transporter substrate-binding protein [Spirochaetia bacterium]